MKRMYAVPTLVHLKVSNRSSRALVYLQLSCGNVQTGFRNVVPLPAVRGWLCFVNLYLHKYIDVAFRLDDHNMGSCFDAPLHIFAGVVIGRQLGHSFVPQVKLMIVRKYSNRLVVQEHRLTDSTHHAAHGT